MCDHNEFLRYPIDGSIKALGKKWAAPVLFELLNGHNSFNTLLDTIPGLSGRALSFVLDNFETNGIIDRERVGSTRVRYCLTEKGQDLRYLIRQITGFSLTWYSQSV